MNSQEKEDDAERRLNAHTIFMVPPAELKASPFENPNFMAPGEYAQLVEAVRQGGFRQPVLVRPVSGGYEIVDGHHRAKAAVEVGIEKIPVVSSEMSDLEARAVALGMNRLRGSIELQVAAKTLDDLTKAGWGNERVAITGFNEEEWHQLVESLHAPKDEEFIAAAAADPEPDEPAPAPLVLEIAFESRDELKRVKKALRKASGPAKNLRVGLLRIIEAE